MGTRDSSKVASSRPAPAANFSETLVGSRFAGFEILQVAGRGGMGLVFRARRTSSGELVALKIVHALSREDREPIRRFLSEARVLGRLDHPALTRIRDMGRRGHRYYLATEWVEGRTVADIIDAGDVFTPRRALEVAREVCVGLGVAHRHGVLHRDVKSDNIMIDDGNRAKILDFGIAQDLTARRRITRGQVYLGTPEYCSPEQLAGQPLDPRTDLYSLGIVLHEMLTGCLPYNGRSTVELYNRKRRNRRPPLARLMPGVPPSLVKLLRAFLAPNRARRFQSADQAVAAIDDVIPTLGAFGWGHPCVRRFARGRRQPARLREAIASLFF